MEETRPKTRKAGTAHLWVNTVALMASALIPVVWDVIKGIAG